jgi:cytochrome c oxidase assembly protein subunit 15
MSASSLVDWAPAARLLLLAALLSLAPLAWVWLRARGAARSDRLAALTALTMFLTFDLVVFGSFTRLTDSGLGCPDWPGCYGSASPLGASGEIAAAEQALPSGPVTWSKAWIEMIHRYLAMTVGALILVLALASWLERRRLPHSPWWATATLVWVVVQGLFGRYTVTWKLYPAIVTLHLLGGLALLALLSIQRERYRALPALPLGPVLRGLAGAALALVMLQVALGGWVSTNYAVLACSGFAQCNGQWWPATDFAQGFTVLRELGRRGDGGLLGFDALVAIHMAHRVFALAVVAVLVALGVRLVRARRAAARRFGLALLALALAQVASGLSNVVLGWPIVAALAHAAGAAALVWVLTVLLTRSSSHRSEAALMQPPTEAAPPPLAALRPAPPAGSA